MNDDNGKKYLPPECCCATLTKVELTDHKIADRHLAVVAGEAAHLVTTELSTAFCPLHRSAAVLYTHISEFLDEVSSSHLEPRAYQLYFALKKDLAEARGERS